MPPIAHKSLGAKSVRGNSVSIRVTEQTNMVAITRQDDGACIRWRPHGRMKALDAAQAVAGV